MCRSALPSQSSYSTLTNKHTQPHNRTIAHGYLAGVHALPRALDADGLRELIHATTPSRAPPPDPFPESRAIDTLALLRRCLTTAVGRAAFPTEAAASFLLECFLLPQCHCQPVVPTATRLAALHLAKGFLPMLAPEAFDGRLSGADGLASALLRGAGRAFDVWASFLDHLPRMAGAGQGAGDTAALALAQLAVLRSVCDASGAWANCVAVAVEASLVAAPTLVVALSSSTTAGGKKGVAEPAALDGLLGALCLLGGDFGTPHVGAEVAYSIAQQSAASSSTSLPSTAVERGRGVVLKVSPALGFGGVCSPTTQSLNNDFGPRTYHQQIELASGNTDPQPDEQGLLFTILPDGDASKAPISVHASGICLLPSAVPHALVQRLVDEAPSLLPAFEALLTPASNLLSAPASVDASLGVAALCDLQARTAKALVTLYANEAFAAAYEPLLPSLARLALTPAPTAAPAQPIQRTRVIESRHPYANNTRETIEVSESVCVCAFPRLLSIRLQLYQLTNTFHHHNPYHN